ncbi:DUF6229 family protein [Streptomyces cinereoruber]|uniref:DUF6229 family protein n=1 Tax=Streptomyces cinereoruber TaxID=67260 RepID=UPI00363E4DE2
MATIGQKVDNVEMLIASWRSGEGCDNPAGAVFLQGVPEAFTEDDPWRRGFTFVTCVGEDCNASTKWHAAGNTAC